MWKNLLIQYRHKVETIVQFLIPILLAIILFALRSGSAYDQHDANTTYKSFDVNTLYPLELVMQWLCLTTKITNSPSFVIEN